MKEEEKIELFKSLFLIDNFFHFLNNKRNKHDFMDMPNSFKILFDCLSDEDIESLINKNVKFGMIYSPASKFEIPITDIPINFICFEKHSLDKFSKEEVVSLVLHEIGHVFNPGLSGDDHEFQADNYAVNRGFSNFIVSSLQLGIDNGWEGFSQDINNRRIDRLRNKK
jgi:hypothetical protein